MATTWGGRLGGETDVGGGACCATLAMTGEERGGGFLWFQSVIRKDICQIQ